VRLGAVARGSSLPDEPNASTRGRRARRRSPRTGAARGPRVDRPPHAQTGRRRAEMRSPTGRPHQARRSARAPSRCRAAPQRRGRPGADHPRAHRARRDPPTGYSLAPAVPRMRASPAARPRRPLGTSTRSPTRRSARARFVCNCGRPCAARAARSPVVPSGDESATTPAVAVRWRSEWRRLRHRVKGRRLCGRSGWAPAAERT
jgi:hypothetical protein